MRTTIIMLLVAFVVAGCPTHLVSSDERSVVVESQSRKADDAQKIADAECAKSKRSAKMTSEAGYWDRNYIFECVDSPSSKADAIDASNKTADASNKPASKQQPSSKAEAVDVPNRTTDAPNRTTPQRFRDLQTLKNEGLITDEEYQQKKKQLLEHL